MKFLPPLQVLLVLIFGNTVTLSGWERIYHFDDDLENFPPKGLVIEAEPGGKALVTVQRNEEARSQPHVLAMRGASFPSTNFLLCLAWFSNVKNGQISTNLRYNEEKSEMRIAGLIWRYQSTTDMYAVEWDLQKTVLTFSATIHGKRKVLKKEKIALPADEWGVLSVKFHDSTIHCDVNGKTVIQAQDSQLIDAGKIGLLLQSDAIILFDDFQIQSED